MGGLLRILGLKVGGLINSVTAAIDTKEVFDSPLMRSQWKVLAKTLPL